MATTKPSTSTAGTSSSSTAPPPPPTTSTTTTTTTTLKTTVPLTFEKKNVNLLHIPHDKNKKYRIEKRPIPRPPVASPYAGATVPKIVYVSSKTPVISAVKRVQKLLRLAERRAMGPVIGNRRSRSHFQHNNKREAGGKGDSVLEKCQRRLGEDKVLVKATGRAIEKALKVGRWFEEGRGGGGEEYEVVVKTGSVCVVDDIVEDDVVEEDDGEEEEEEGKKMEDDVPPMTNTNNENPTTTNTEEKEKEEREESKNQRRRRRKRERIREQRLKAFRDEDGETPESRTRWVNMVEIAINMK